LGSLGNPALTCPVYFLQAVPASKWLSFNIVAWGIATACGAAATNYTTLLVSRVFLGVFEATIGPSLMLISSQYYTKAEAAPRFSFWYLGLGLGQIIGGAISYGFQHVTGGGLAGWRVMFIVLGAVTVCVGLGVFVFIPDTPMKASWMTDAEKVALLKHVSVNQTGITDKKFRPKQIIDALSDPQIYLMTLAVVLVSFPFTPLTLVVSDTSTPSSPCPAVSLRPTRPLLSATSATPPSRQL
jgi:MFS transporter, ACS family, DAL5 transporter family protein